MFPAVVKATRFRENFN